MSPKNVYQLPAENFKNFHNLYISNGNLLLPGKLQEASA
jgi:hypothetical protein